MPSPVVQGNEVQSLAVKVFFVVSGYLITQSWLSDPSLIRYLAKRVLRIFPALIFVVCLSALVLGPAISVLPVAAYFHAPELSFYFRNIVLYPVYSLPGVFGTNAYPDAVNGSLWSLPVEFSMYLLLPVLAWRVRGAAIFLVPAALLLCGCSLYELRGTGGFLTPAVVVFGTNLRSALDVAPYFLIGASLYSLRAWLKPDIQLAVVFGTVALLAPPGGVCPELALYLALPYAVIALASAEPARFSFFERYGDLSYGTYLFGFPVQQLVVQVFATAQHPLRTFVLALPPTLLLAFISWHWIEKRMIALKPQKSVIARPRSGRGNPSFLGIARKMDCFADARNDVGGFKANNREIGRSWATTPGPDE